MAYLGANIYSYNSGVTYSKGDVVADASATASTTLSAAVATGDTTIVVTSATSIVVGMVVSAASGYAISSGTTVTAISGTTITLSRPLIGSFASGLKVTFTTYWTSASDGNVAHAPATSSPYWIAGATVPYTWVTGDKSLTTDLIKTDTHDLLTGTVFHTGSDAGNLYIQQSSDGKNWDYISAAVLTVSATIDGAYNTVAGYSVKFSETIVAPYARLKFVYGTALPTIFRLNARTSDSGVKY